MLCRAEIFNFQCRQKHFRAMKKWNLVKPIRRIENHFKSENKICMQLLPVWVLILWLNHLFEVCWSNCDLVTHLPRRDIFSESDHLRHWNFDRDENIFVFFTTSGTKIHFCDGKCENIFLFDWKNVVIAIQSSHWFINFLFIIFIIGPASAWSTSVKFG